MILTEIQRNELEMASMPLIKWLNENCHPHVVAIVEPGGVRLLEDIYCAPILDYIKD